MDQEKVEFYKVRTTSEIISATMAVVKQGAKPLFLSLLFIVVPFALLQIVIQDAFVIDAQNSGSPVDLFLKAIAIYALLGITLTLITVVSYSFLEVYRKKENVTEITVGDVWSEAVDHGLQSVLGMVLYFIFVVIGLVLIIFPGIWIAIALSMLFPVIVFERKNALDAIGRSHYLVKNYWWNTLGVLLLVTIVYYLISLIFLVPSLIAGIFLGLNGLEVEALEASPVMTAVSAVASFSYLFYPIIYIATAFQYFNLVERKEAKGLQDKVDMIGQSSK